MNKLQQMKRMMIVAIVFLMANTTLPTYAQSCFSNNYTGFSNTTDYLNVNRNNFIVTNAGSDLENYHHTALKLAIEIGKIADVNGNEVVCSTNGFHSNTPINIMNKYTAYRVEYTPEITSTFLLTQIKFKLRAVIIKPNNAVNAPCVFITHGNMGVLRDWRAYYMYGVLDYLMKGYTVVIYENLSTLRRVKNTNPFNPCPASFPFQNAPAELYGFGVPIFSVVLPNIATVHNRWKAYSLITGEAIVKYTIGNSNLYGIDVNKLHAYGYSFGTSNTEAILLTKKNEFPTNAYSGNYISPTNFTLSIYNSILYNIKSGIIMSGGYADHDVASNKVDVYTNDDTLKRILMIHGLGDCVTELSCYNNVFPKKTNKLDQLKIPNYLINVCNSGHNIYNLLSQDFIISTITIDKIGNRNYPFYNFIRNLTPININTMASTINGNATYKAFFDTLRAINSQAFQIHKAGSQFYVNTMNNTPYVMCATENTYNRKSYIGVNGTPSATPYVSGNWIYQIRNSNCQPISNQRISKETPIITVPFLPKNSVYPNPSNGLLNARIILENAIDAYTILVYNAQGSIVVEQKVQEQLEQGSILQKQIDLSQQPSGVYYIQIHNAGKILVNEKILITK